MEKQKYYIERIRMIRLRAIREEDQDMIREWRMKPEVTKYMYTDPVITKESQKIWFRSIAYDESLKIWVIQYDDNDIGLLNITGIDKVNERCDWAYYIADDSYRGKGIGGTLECNIYDYVFNHLGLNKLCCEVFTFNEKVIKLHEKYGSEVEGTRREHIIKNGTKYDIVEMAILKEKWMSIRGDYDYPVIEIE